MQIDQYALLLGCIVADLLHLVSICMKMYMTLRFPIQQVRTTDQPALALTMSFCEWKFIKKLWRGPIICARRLLLDARIG